MLPVIFINLSFLNFIGNCEVRKVIKNCLSYKVNHEAYILTVSCSNWKLTLNLSWRRATPEFMFGKTIK
jgi:hypothetical protein